MVRAEETEQLARPDPLGNQEGPVALVVPLAQEEMQEMAGAFQFSPPIHLESLSTLPAFAGHYGSCRRPRRWWAWRNGRTTNGA